MNKYFFRIKMKDCESSARIQIVVWADTLEDAESEIIRVYGDVNPINFEL